MFNQDDEIAGVKVKDAVAEYQRRKSLGMASESTMSSENECARCKDTGWLSGDQELVRCACYKPPQPDQSEMLWRISGLPETAREHSFKLWRKSERMQEAYRAAVELGDNTGEVRWLTIIGSPGTGKTHLAHAICLEWLERGVSCKFAVAPRLLNDLRLSFQPDSPVKYDAVIQSMIATPLLVIDDLGMEKQSDWALEQLDLIVDERYSARRPLMVTSNLSLPRLPERIASRLERAPGAEVVVIQ